MIQKKTYSVLLLSITSFALSGCGASTSTSTSTVNVHLQNFKLNTGTAVSANQNRKPLTERAALKGGTSRASGYNLASQLVSLKYLFTSIALCQSTDATSAFGFTTESGCTSLYSNSKSVTEGATVSQILSVFNASTDAFDLMSSTDITRLNANAGAATTGTYNYVLVNWAPAIGVSGTVTVPSSPSTTLTTQAYTSIASGTNGGYPTTTQPSMTASPTPSLTYVQSANGGSVFKFQKALTVAAGSSYYLDIIFNPTGVLDGCSAGTTGNITDGVHGMYMPMLPVTAVLRATTDTLVRESYPLTINSTYSMEVDLYYLQSDTTKSIVAAQIVGLPANTDSQTCYTPDIRVFTATTATDGSITLASGTTTASNILTGLVRGSSSSGTTVTFNTSNGDGGVTTALPSGVSTATEGAMTETTYQ